MDRLSCLPDEIICDVLSFLWTKKSVQTSVLSKRWRFLWTHVPSLDFRVYDTLNSKIVTKIVLQHKHDIHTFHLIDKDLHGSEDEFQSWILNITTRNVRNLVMDLKNQFVLPRGIFTCKTLVDLSLTGCGDIPMSGIYFPSLKKLSLNRVKYESHESITHLISGCPVLEELSIEGKVWVLGRSCVSSPTLTRLTIKPYWGGVVDFGVKLDTPALRYLWLDCVMPDVLSPGTLDSVIVTDASFYWDKPQQDNFTYSRNVLTLLGSLYNVKLLKLRARYVAAVHDSAFFTSAVKFHNLTKLDLGCNLGLIRFFLENANNLRAVKIHCYTKGDIDNQYHWMEPKRVPACLISHLQSVNLYFCGSEDEFDMVRYILMNAKVLNAMEIDISCCKYYPKKRFRVLERRRRRLFENAQECHIVFV